MGRRAVDGIRDGRKSKRVAYLSLKLLELGLLLRLVRFYLLLGLVARFADALCAVCYWFPLLVSDASFPISFSH